MSWLPLKRNWKKHWVTCGTEWCGTDITSTSHAVSKTGLNCVRCHCWGTRDKQWCFSRIHCTWNVKRKHHPSVSLRMPGLKCCVRKSYCLGKSACLRSICPWNFLLSVYLSSEHGAGLRGVLRIFGGRNDWGLLARVHRARAKACRAEKEITVFEYCSAVLSIYSIKSKQTSAERKQAVIAGDVFNLRNVLQWQKK